MTVAREAISLPTVVAISSLSYDLFSILRSGSNVVFNDVVASQDSDRPAQKAAADVVKSQRSTNETPLSDYRRPATKVLMLLITRTKLRKFASYTLSVTFHSETSVNYCNTTLSLRFVN